MAACFDIADFQQLSETLSRPGPIVAAFGLLQRLRVLSEPTTLLVSPPTIGKLPHALAPRPVAAGLQRVAHHSLHSVGPYAVNHFDVCKTD